MTSRRRAPGSSTAEAYSSTTRNKWRARYFDAFLYYAIRSCQRLAFRFPKGLLDEQPHQPYRLEFSEILANDLNDHQWTSLPILGFTRPLSVGMSCEDSRVDKTTSLRHNLPTIEHILQRL